MQLIFYEKAEFFLWRLSCFNRMCALIWAIIFRGKEIVGVGGDVHHKVTFNRELIKHVTLHGQQKRITRASDDSCHISRPQYDNLLCRLVNRSCQSEGSNLCLMRRSMNNSRMCPLVIKDSEVYNFRESVKRIKVKIFTKIFLIACLNLKLVQTENLTWHWAIKLNMRVANF